jgi:hypothetical protein
MRNLDRESGESDDEFEERYRRLDYEEGEEDENDLM